MHMELQLLILSLWPLQFCLLFVLIGLLYLIPPFFEQLLAAGWIIMYFLLEELHDLEAVDGVKCNKYVLLTEVSVCLKKIRVLLFDVAIQSNKAEILVETKAFVSLCLFVLTLEGVSSPLSVFGDFLFLQEHFRFATLLRGKVILLFLYLGHQ